MRRFTVALPDKVADRATREAIAARRPLRSHLEYLLEKAVNSTQLPEDATHAGVSTPEVAHA